MTLVTENSRPLIEGVFKYLFQHKIYMIVGKDRLLQLPEPLRGFASYATEEFLSALSHPTTRHRSEVLLFPSENDLVRALHGLRQEGQRFQDYELSSVCGPPVLLLKHSVEVSPEKIVFNSCSNEVLEIEKEQLPLISDCIFVAKVAQTKGMFIVEDSEGIALEMELDEGKRYAFGFLEREEALPTLEGLSQENPGCRIRKNDLLSMLHGILSSELHGLLINPATTYQMTLHKQQLEVLLIGAQKHKHDTRLSVGNLMKNLFAKPKH